MYYMNIKP